MSGGEMTEPTKEDYKYTLRVVMSKIHQLRDGEISLDEFLDWVKIMDEGKPNVTDRN